MASTSPSGASVALVTHRACLAHRTPDGHPESSLRLAVVLEALSESEFASIARVPAPRATREQLVRVHTPEYVDAILATRPQRGAIVRLDPDTWMSPWSAEAALRAAGGATLAVDLVMSGEARAVFAAVR